MGYYAVLLPMKDQEKSAQHRDAHLEYLARLRETGEIVVNGTFTDRTGGLVIYQANSYKEVVHLIKKDPYVLLGARGYEVHEWEVVTGKGFA